MLYNVMLTVFKKVTRLCEWTSTFYISGQDARKTSTRGLLWMPNCFTPPRRFLPPLLDHFHRLRINISVVISGVLLWTKDARKHTFPQECILPDT